MSTYRHHVPIGDGLKPRNAAQALLGRMVMCQAYVFHRAEDQKEPERLRLIECTCDPASQRLRATGLRPGWRCLEVGLGAGSILDWVNEVEPIDRSDASR